MRTVVLPDPEELHASFLDDPAAPSSAVESQDEAGQMDWSSFDEECVKPKNKLPPGQTHGKRSKLVDVPEERAAAKPDDELAVKPEQLQGAVKKHHGKQANEELLHAVIEEDVKEDVKEENFKLPDAVGIEPQIRELDPEELPDAADSDVIVEEEADEEFYSADGGRQKRARLRRMKVGHPRLVLRRRGGRTTDPRRIGSISSSFLEERLPLRERTFRDRRAKWFRRESEGEGGEGGQGGQGGQGVDGDDKAKKAE